MMSHMHHWCVLAMHTEIWEQPWQVKKHTHRDRPQKRLQVLLNKDIKK